jgi:uncharacterized damage-inducible protein DinB
MDRLNEGAAVRAATLKLVAPLSQAQFDFAPKPGTWSVGEVVDHILLAEALYREEIGRLIELKRSGRRPYLRHTFDDINVAPLHLPIVVLNWMSLPLTMMNAFMPGIVRDLATEYAVVPTRNPDRTTPRPHRNATVLRTELLTSQAGMRELVSANADLDMREMISEHPLTGASSVPDILAFLARHERRHQRQIAGVTADRSFPTR